MIDKIKEYIAEAQAFSTQNGAELEAFRIKFLGSKGLLKELFAEFKNVPNEQKKEFGQVINLLKTTAEDKVKSIQEGDIIPEKAARAAQLSFEKYCSVSKTLEPTATIHYKVVLNGEEL